MTVTGGVRFNPYDPATWAEVEVERCPATTRWDDRIDTSSLRYVARGVENVESGEPRCPGQHLWQWVSTLKLGWIRRHSPVPVVAGVRRAPHPYVRFCDRPSE